jgi:hypothetical protein
VNRRLLYFYGSPGSVQESNMEDTVDATDEVRPDIDASMDEAQESIGTNAHASAPELGDDIPVHPLAAAFPMMDEEELERLAEDIRSNGLINPVVLDKTGQLIDGRNRLRACQLADIAVALKDLPKPRQELVLRWVMESLGIAPTQVAPTPAVTTPPWSHRAPLRPKPRASTNSVRRCCSGPRTGGRRCGRSRESQRPDFVRADAELRPGLLEGLVSHEAYNRMALPPTDRGIVVNTEVASPTIPSWNQIAEFLNAMQGLRAVCGSAA